MLILIFWMLYPYRIIEFKNEPFPIEAKTVEQGGLLNYTVSYCKFEAIGATVTKIFTDGILYTMPAIETNRPVGCDSNLVYVKVPPELPKGKYTLTSIYRFKPNPVRTVDYVVHTEDFYIIEKGDE